MDANKQHHGSKHVYFGRCVDDAALTSALLARRLEESDAMVQRCLHKQQELTERVRAIEQLMHATLAQRIEGGAATTTKKSTVSCRRIRFSVRLLSPR